MPTIIHTADIHLGAPLGWLGKKAREQRDELGRALTRIVDKALDERVGCLVIAGDLFDSNSPPASAVRHALSEFRRLSEISDAVAVVLPGSHDHLGRGSVYLSYREEFKSVEGLTVLGLDGQETVAIPHLGLAVHGRPPRWNRSTDHQLARLEPDHSLPFNIVVAHGTLDTVPRADDDLPIDLSEVSGTPWSYAALGHWHSWHEVPGSEVPALYPGAPEVIAPSQSGAGFAARVDLTTEGAEISQVRIGARRVVTADVDVTSTRGTHEIVERVRYEAPPGRDTILRLALGGLLDLDADFDEAGLLEALEPDYFHVCPPERRYRVKLGREDLERLSERLVIGRFVRLMQEKISGAKSDEERERVEAAMQMGVALLLGKDVLG